MDKEEYRRAFNAGMEYWQWVQTDEPMFNKPIDFEEWYNTVIFPQENEPKSPCCGIELKKITNNKYYGCLECGKVYELTECKYIKCF